MGVKLIVEEGRIDIGVQFITQARISKLT